MRVVPLLLAAALGGWAQSERVTYTLDVNGRRVSVEEHAATNGSSRQVTQNINGRRVTLESSEEKEVSSGPSGRVVERVVRQFDAAGQPAGATKIRVEERKNPDGTATTVTAIYDNTLNGTYALRERTTALSSRSGDITRTQTIAERPALNGRLEIVEKRTAEEQPARRDVTVYRHDGAGGFTLSEREIAVTAEQGGVKTSTIEKYNTTATGKLALAGQQVRRVETRPDGSEVEVVDVFGAGVGNYSAKPALREQQIIERKPGPGQTVTESFSIRRPELGSEKLGAAQAIAETVCTGKCR